MSLVVLTLGMPHLRICKTVPEKLAIIFSFVSALNSCIARSLVYTLFSKSCPYFLQKVFSGMSTSCEIRFLEAPLRFRHRYVGSYPRRVPLSGEDL